MNINSIKRVIFNPSIKNSDYRRVWLSSAFNMMGMAGEQVIVGFLIYHITQSTAWVGISLALYFGPMLVFGIPAGIIADRYQRRMLIPACELGILIILGGYTLLLFQGEPTVLSLLTVTLISGSLRAVYFPIRTSYVYDLVGSENIVSSLGLLNISVRCGQLVGAALSGLVLKLYSPGHAFLVLFCGHCLAFVLLLRLGNAGRSKDYLRSSVLTELKQYWNEITHNQSLLILIAVTACIEIFGFSFVTALPEIAKLKLGMDADGLGFMHTARAIGGMLAGIIFASSINLPYKGRIYVAVVFGFGFFVMGLGLAPSYGLALLAIAAIAAMAASSDVLSQSMMQLVVPDYLRGRAMGAWVFAAGIAPIGHIEAGFLAELFGADRAMVINGVALIICSVVLVLLPGKLKNL